MKILQLNVWTGRVKGALLEYFKNNDFDVICLQEAVWSNRNDVLENFCVTVEQIQEASGLPYVARSTNWQLEFVDDGGLLEEGNVVLSRERAVDEKSYSVYGECKHVKSIEDIRGHEYTVQVLKLESGVNIVNHHGYWLPTPTGDETTVEVMKRVSDIVQGIEGPVVMCGDLNIISSAPAMRELDFLQDLTEKYSIDNTLSGLKFNGKVACDHILVNDKVSVRDFKVVEDLISDHKGLIVEIDV